MPQIVALDIETTGFDPNNDKIIEIGAIRFNHNRIEKEWSSLINPGCTIPLPITQLTGITNQMVKNAPIINDVIDSFNDFLSINVCGFTTTSLNDISSGICEYKPLNIYLMMFLMIVINCVSDNNNTSNDDLLFCDTSVLKLVTV